MRTNASSVVPLMTAVRAAVLPAPVGGRKPAFALCHTLLATGGFSNFRTSQLSVLPMGSVDADLRAALILLVALPDAYCWYRAAGPAQRVAQCTCFRAVTDTRSPTMHPSFCVLRFPLCDFLMLLSFMIMRSSHDSCSCKDS